MAFMRTQLEDNTAGTSRRHPAYTAPEGGMYMRIAIVGYGNQGQGRSLPYATATTARRGVLPAVTRRNPDTHRDPGLSGGGYPFVGRKNWMYCCFAAAVRRICRGHPGAGGTLEVVDSFDNHRDIPAHFARTDAVGAGRRAPCPDCGRMGSGAFSLLRLYADAVLPDGQTYTFWGTGVSRGHPMRCGGLPECGTRGRTPIRYRKRWRRRAGGTPDPTYLHRRVVYAVAEPGADRARLRQEILSIPGYFAGCDTTVLFISQEEMNRDHAGLPHGGCVLRTGHTGAAGEHVQRLEARLRLDSNPEFTGRVLVACAAPSGACGRRDAPAASTVMDLPLPPYPRFRRNS